MENQILNPYRAPESVVADVAPAMSPEHFKRVNAWAVLGLCIVTAGFYYIYWLYTRAQATNLYPGGKLSRALLVAFVGLAILSIPVRFVHPDRGTALWAMAFGLRAVDLAVNLILLFAVKRRLEDIFGQKLSGVWTFFGSAMYLQHKINQQIDQAAA